MEVWQAMDLPLQGPQQAAVLSSIMNFCLDHEPTGGARRERACARLGLYAMSSITITGDFLSVPSLVE